MKKLKEIGIILCQTLILTSITTTGPNKTTYKVGETLDLTGLVVTAHYSDGSDKVITDYEVSEVDLSTAGNKVVIIRYQEQTAAFTITVDEAGHSSVTLTSISIEGTYKTEYNVGETLDLTGLIVRGQYSDGSSKEITNYQVGKVDMSTPGIKRVNITYIDKMTYFEITIKDNAYKANQQIVSIIVTSVAIGGGVIVVGAIVLAVILSKRKKH